MTEQTAGSYEEKTRKCPACRSVISILAATCRFCGRDVPPQMVEIRKLTVDELAGKSVGAAEDPLAELGPFARDLTRAAREGGLAAPCDREKEVADIIEFLNHKKRTNLLLLGGLGVGKTTLMEAVALRLALGEENAAPDRCRIVQIELGSVRSSNQRIMDRLSALARLSERVRELVVFLDDIFPLLATTHVHGSPQQILSSMIRNNDIWCIATITPEQYKKAQDVSATIRDGFEIYHVDPLDAKTTLDILQQEQPLLEKQYGVRIGSKALAAAVDLSREFMPKQQLPGKALEVLKHACNRYKRKCIMRQTYPEEWQDEMSMKHLADKVGVHDVKRTIAEITSIDIDKAEAELWTQKLAQRLDRFVLGQEAALRKVAAAVAQTRLRFRTPGNTAGVLLFVGPPGVGKIHAARTLAQQLLGSQEDLAILDMSEYAGADGVQRLFGFRPGETGSLDSGTLACVVRDTPLAIVVLENLDKAHSDVHGALIPVLATGTCRDPQGHELSLMKCLLIMTVDCAASPEKITTESLKETLQCGLSRELLQRVDSIVPFKELEPGVVRDILRRSMELFYEELRPHEIRMRVSDPAYKTLIDLAYSREQGIGGLPAVLEQNVFRPIRELMSAKKVLRGGAIEIVAEQNRVAVKIV